MITAGVDCGAQAVKVVILSDDQVAGSCRRVNGPDQPAAALTCMEQALAAAGLVWAALSGTVATGAGRRSLSWATGEVSDVTASALGAVHLQPGARTVLDVGAEEARALRCDAAGRVLDFALNEKCAAGTGAFVEAMARALGVAAGQLGALAMEGAATASVNAQCAVFAESEVVSLVHANVPTADIARAVHTAIAGRLASLATRVGLEPEVALVGGLAGDAALVRALTDSLGVQIVVPPLAEYAGALGAAIAARRLPRP